MVIRMDAAARLVVKNAETEARARRSPLIEAEHLLLAMAEPAGADAARVLGAFGLTHESIDDALDREFESSLAVAGVAVAVRSLPRPSGESPRRLRISASFKAALERALRAADGSAQIRPVHLLLGVLGAEAGTVPRSLHLVGVDPAELAARARPGLGE